MLLIELAVEGFLQAIILIMNRLALCRNFLSPFFFRRIDPPQSPL
jgi:hypothetical protein